jgi:hypothetical protein
MKLLKKIDNVLADALEGIFEWATDKIERNLFLNVITALILGLLFMFFILISIICY